MDNLNQNDGKDNSAIVTIFVIFLILIATGLVTFFIYKEGFFNKNQVDIIQNISVYEKINDYYTKETIEVNYELFEGIPLIKCIENKTIYKMFLNNISEFFLYYPELEDKIIDEKGCYSYDTKLIEVNKGTFSKGLNEMLLKEKSLYFLYLYDKTKYYVQKSVLIPEKTERTLINGTKVEDKIVYYEDLYPIENNLSIELFGEIQSNYTNTVRLFLLGTKKLRNIHICWEYSFGILDIESKYKQSKKPNHLKEIPNKCFILDSDNGKENGFKSYFDFNITTTSLIPSDYIKVIVIDKDQYNDGNNKLIWDWGFENNKGENIGAVDFDRIFYPFKTSN